MMKKKIIPYQEIIGNYSCQGWYGILESLSIPQNKKNRCLELYKLYKRKDTWIFLTVILVPILYSVGIASGS